MAAVQGLNATSRTLMEIKNLEWFVTWANMVDKHGGHPFGFVSGSFFSPAFSGGLAGTGVFGGSVTISK